MKRIATILLVIASSSADAGELQNMYGLGVLEPESGHNSSGSDSYLEIMVGRGSLKDSAVKNSAGTNLGAASFGHGTGGSIAYGTEFMKPFLWEIELGYNENDVKSAPANSLEGKLKSYTAMGNLLLEANFLPVVQPFFGAGAGYAHISDDKSGDNVFAYQGIGGITFDIVDGFDIVAEYKYLRADDVEFSNSSNKKFDYIDQNVEIGVRFGL